MRVEFNCDCGNLLAVVFPDYMLPGLRAASADFIVCSQCEQGYDLPRPREKYGRGQFDALMETAEAKPRAAHTMSARSDSGGCERASAGPVCDEA